MNVTLETAIEMLRPSAQARAATTRPVIRPSAWHGRKAQREHAKAIAAARAATEAELIKDAQVCGLLPAVLMPLVWKLIWHVAWQAIQYWLNNIHEGDGA